MAEALSFEKVWAMFQETREQMKEQINEYREQMKKHKEQMEEADRKKKEDWEKMTRELDRRFKETDRKIGELGNRFGELAEHLVAPSINEKFNELNFTFENTSQNHVIRDASGRCIAEIDLLLENGDTIMVVEVKSKPQQQDVDEHINRIEVLRRRADSRNDTRKFRGAIAGAIMSEAVRNYAHKTGFYVIEQTGDTVKINIPEDFTPQEW